MKDPELLRLRAEFEDAERRLDWEQARKSALLTAKAAIRIGDRRIMDDMGKVLAPLGEYARSGELRIQSRRMSGPMRIEEWLGQDISSQTLLIDLMETESQGLAVAIRAASLVSEAIKRARHTIIVVESRLVPLYARTFPAAGIVAYGPGAADAYRRADVCASVQHLTAQFGTDPARIRSQFHPLAVNENLAAELRNQYRNEGAAPLVGISWTSAAVKKDMPGLEDWSRLLSTIPASFVSLQYGNVEPELAVLRASSRTIIHDPSVDQLRDMDRFASQVKAMDAVVTVSNTGAHLAGSLGIPSVVIIDDKIRNWPVFERNSPYYPSMAVVRRNGKSWAATLDAAQAELETILKAPKPPSQSRSR